MELVINEKESINEQETYSNWVGCMYHLSSSEFDVLEEILKEYDIGGYIIAHEVEPYPHFHLVFEELDENVYVNMNKKIVEKYKLRACSKKGIRKQYGKITSIKDIDKLKSYTVKDGNYRTNLSPEEMTKVLENSFKKQKKTEWLEKCIAHVESMPGLWCYKDYTTPSGKWRCYDIDEMIGKELIKFHIEKEVKFTFNAIKSMVRYAIQQTTHIDIIEKADILWHLK